MMNTPRILSLLATMFLAVSFFSCGDDDNDAVAPTITFKAAGDALTGDATVTVGDSISFSWEVVAQTNRLESFVIRLDNDDIFQPVDIDRDEYEGEYGQVMDSVGVFDFVFIAEDRDGLITRVNIVVTVEPVAPVTTPLDAAVALTWERVGSNAGTGLSDVGLAWTSNTATSAQITKGTATKFVQLTSDEWTSITTEEALQAAVDAGTDIDSFEEISATEASETYDFVLATQVGDDYYLINITGSSVNSSGAAGTTVSVTGEYKE